MFLSKLPVNVRSRDFRRDFADVQAMHRRVLSGFPDLEADVPARQHHGVLWRLDSGQRGYAVYVQSHSRPDWSPLPQDYLTARAEVRCLQPVLAAIEPGRLFGFRLVANPTRTVHREGTPGNRGSGKRVGLEQPEDQVQWLLRQGERHGFALPETDVFGPDVAPTPIPKLTGYKEDDTKSGRSKITIAQVRFDGHLQVTDPEALAAALKNGIGRAKAYGCGLLSLAPAQRRTGGRAEGLEAQRA